MTELLARLNELAQPGQILTDEPMSRHTTFRVGGPADMFFMPSSGAQVALAIAAAKRAGADCVVIGNGSNLVVRDGGIRGLVIALGEGMARVLREGDVIMAQAGASLARVAAFAQTEGLSGLEFAGGIPGTLGGGCAMNAGAYGGQLSDVLIDAEVLVDGQVRTLPREALEMGYRTSMPLRAGGVVLSARFALTPDDPEAIAGRMRELNARRREKQPLNLPSAGSTFKRPEGHFAGALIEQAGLKGRSVGGAQVSEKHAGFIVNTGSATAADILELIATVQSEVMARFGVALETEVRVLGED
ncbi:MAG: UDP-N-acetylmuramate dehydrogenase [Clostridia bacterium]|nr:UDP-N-acetylmuramate dehydrogenase [Clostridia bacterium]